MASVGRLGLPLSLLLPPLLLGALEAELFLRRRRVLKRTRLSLGV
jgi:hypothetical protein